MKQMKFAKGLADLAPREVLLSMSGLEYMQAITAGRMPHPPMASTLDYRLHSVEQDRVAFRGTPGEGVANPMGAVHGGWYGAMLDSAMGCAVMTRVPKASVYTTLEYKINLTRGVPIGTEVEAVAWVQHAGQSTGVAAAEMRGIADGKLYATASTTCIIMEMT